MDTTEGHEARGNEAGGNKHDCIIENVIDIRDANMSATNNQLTHVINHGDCDYVYYEDYDCQHNNDVPSVPSPFSAPYAIAPESVTATLSGVPEMPPVGQCSANLSEVLD